MLLVCFGTRPEIIKLIPVIRELAAREVPHKLLFTGQHSDLIGKFYRYIDTSNVIELEGVFERGQTLNSMTSKIIVAAEKTFGDTCATGVVVQGDTTSGLAIAMAAFNARVRVIHVEAGLRTGNKHSPFPEEMNRRMMSQLADVHLCPTPRAVANLAAESITENVHHVGNTVVDMFDFIRGEVVSPDDSVEPYVVVTLHRRENRGDKMRDMWRQLHEVSSRVRVVYICHPSIPESREELGGNERIRVIDPVGYEDMVRLILNSSGIITDSGGLQEEAVCAGKKVLVCRDTTERPETIECGLGLLVESRIIDNIDFVMSPASCADNPYGSNVSTQIVDIIT